MPLPVTRYYGSKRKLVEKIWMVLEDRNIQFQSVLDLFGGTGILSYYMQRMGKQVFYNDIFLFNCQIAKALMDTPIGSWTEADALLILHEKTGKKYHHIIEKNFDGIYYNADENRLIDIVVQNIQDLPIEKQASAYYILIQSCLIKRPFNLFHRKNLNLRTNYTTSNFGNKTTWEQSFHDLFIKFTHELNTYQFMAQPHVQITNQSALTCDSRADLVYIDTPYFNKTGTPVSYHARYHFLEGLMHYQEIPQYIDDHKNNKEIEINKNTEFEQKCHYIDDLEHLFDRYPHSSLAMSYTSNGYPSIEELRDLMSRYKNHVEVVSLGYHAFALNRHNEGREEVLIIGT